MELANFRCLRGASEFAERVIGHASIVTTQRYACLSDDAIRREADRVHRNPIVIHGDEVEVVVTK